MKNALILLTLLIFGFMDNLIAQDTKSKGAIPVPPPSNIERYGVDYELKDYVFVNGDSSILNLLDIEYIEYLRSETQNIEVIDATSGVTIILFFEKKKVNIDPSSTLNQKL
ncbi:MAG: hypothetical protein COA33_002840 [Fluviicola sp.]|nr:hypothetical protein [Fluviicola sp.]